MFYHKYNSPLGIIVMQSDGEVLIGLWFENGVDSAKLNLGEEKELLIFKKTVKWLDIYFGGTNPNFIPKYKILNMTPFRELVIKIIEKIPYGKTISYNDIALKIAKQLGIKKMSPQAVGNAVGWNPICIIVPCHRVVGANGNLTGYRGGLKNKVELLRLEHNDMNKFSMPKNKNKISNIVLKKTIYK